MKKTNLFLLVLFVSVFTMLPVTHYAQDNLPSKDDIQEDFKNDTLTSDFAKVFSANEDKTNFKKLRSYLQRKQNAIELIQAEMAYYSDIQRNLTAISDKDREIDAVLENMKTNTLTEGSIDVYFPNCNINIYSTQKLSIQHLKDLKNSLKSCIDSEKKREAQYECLKSNLKEVKKDVALCQDQIDSALAPEYQNQEFRKTISIGFACLLGGLLAIFVVVVFRSPKNIADYFFSDTGLQFVTIFVLIIAIILFGILGVLEGKELAAILAGISGFILGKSRPAPVVVPAVTPVATTVASTTVSTVTPAPVKPVPPAPESND
ncbi:MAG: hypothetical protein Q8M29_17380 [Bacteroidota bacterium]|nr:hypothetical protein [Bacteroidota bacterium]